MKLNFSCFLVFLLQIGYFQVTAQDKKLPVKVIMTYAVGGSSWRVPGIYSTTETFEIVPINNKWFKISKFLRIKQSLGADSSTVTKDTMKMNVNRNLRFSKAKIDSLLISLTTTKDNFNTAFIKPQLIKPKEKQILAVARKYDKYYKFEDDDRSERKQKFKKIRVFDKLDVFIKLNKPDPELSFGIVDAWNRMTISYIHENDTIKYWSEFHQLLGQPVEPLLNKNANLVRNTVNLEINLLIESMLPKSSLLRKQIGLNSLTEAYINWYIDKML